MTAHFKVLEVEDAAFFAGELFQRVFGAPIPTYPRHFVCLYRKDAATLLPVGYVHFSRFESMHLSGGQVVDRDAYPAIPPEHLDELPHRSIGEYLMAEGIRQLGPTAAVFAFIGAPRSVAVNRDVGYVPTHVQNLYAFWLQDFPAEVKRAAAERVARIAPF